MSPCEIYDNYGSVRMQVSFAIYLMGFVAWCGWWFYMVYAGLGLSVLFIDKIMTCKRRP